MAPPTPRLAEALAGRYDIEREIGAGGMATVYLAHDPRHGRRVAIKVLRPELATAIGAARFLAEIRTTANLLHPHILPLYDSGEVDGTVFYVMPYVEGPTLRDRIARAGRLSIDETIRLATEVAGALQHAHSRGIVHRDIKPANILLEGDHAIVADFGIALTARTHDDLRMTDTGMALGTPTYMSPEQAAGERRLDARSDVYSLGCVVYEMLAGVPPFEAPTAQGLLAKVMTEPPQPLLQVRGDVPPHVDAAVRTALSKRAEDRFATTLAFADALRVPITSGPRAAHSADVVAPVPRGARRRSPGAAGLVVAALVAIGAAAWFVARGDGVSIPAPIAAVAGPRTAAPLTVLLGAIENRTGDETYDALLPELLATSLEQSRTVAVYPRSNVPFVLRRMQRDAATPVDAAMGREIAEREGLSAVIRQSLTRLGDSYVLVATAERPDGQQVASVRETFAAPEELPAKMDAIGNALRRAFGESADELATASRPLEQVTSRSLEAVRSYSLGRARLLAGDPRGAIVLLRRAIELDPEFASAHGALGVAHTNVQDNVSAAAALAIAARLADRAPELEREKILGDFAMIRRDFAAACPHFEVLAATRPLDPNAHLSLGWCSAQRLDFARALAETNRSFELQPSPRTQINRAMVRFLSGDLTGAREDARAVREQAPTLMQAWYVEGLTYLAAQDLDAARTHYTAMLAQGGDFELEGHSGLADLSRALGDAVEAARHLEAARAIATARASVASAASASIRLAELRLAAGDAAGAASMLAGARDATDPWLLYHGARVWAQADRADSARAVVARLEALAIGPSPQHDALRALVAAELALADGRGADAVLAAERALSAEASTVAQETAARAYARAGRTSEAIRAYEAVIARPQERCYSYDAPACFRVTEAQAARRRLGGAP